jgi:hypothetical protein
MRRRDSNVASTNQRTCSLSQVIERPIENVTSNEQRRRTPNDRFIQCAHHSHPQICSFLKANIPPPLIEPAQKKSARVSIQGL